MTEEELVAVALKPYEHPKVGASRLGLIKKIENTMAGLLGNLRELNKDSFQLSQNTFLILYSILTAKKIDDVVAFVGQYKSRALINVAEELFSLRNQDEEWCRAIMANIQHRFFDKAMELVSLPEERAKQEMLLFREKYGNSNAADGIDLENKLEQATRTRLDVERRFLKYSIKI